MNVRSKNETAKKNYIRTLKMTWTNNRNFKLVVLKFQLLVVFYLINGRLAYKGYLSDDANEYNRELNSNFSQINSNEPPGKPFIFRLSKAFSISSIN